MLFARFQSNLIEAGCDEAGRGCLAGPVFAAAVILPEDYRNTELDDSKKLNSHKRRQLREEIQRDALAYAVASVSAQEIDTINIHNASYLAMHKALDLLHLEAEFVIVDGNKFIPYKEVGHECIVKGDGKYLSIAAASILAKTYRDDYMSEIAKEYPQYGWNKNMGYPTVAHRRAIIQNGVTSYHRKSFRVSDPQLKLFERDLLKR